MNSYHLNPYVHIIENHIFPGMIQYGIFHQLTGEVLDPSGTVRSLLLALRLGSQISLSDQDLEHGGEDARQLKELIRREFLIRDGHDPLASFLDHYVVRPIQNPAVAYQSEAGQWMLVRTSMGQRIFSPGPDELPKVIVEPLLEPAATLFLSADGSKTLARIFEEVWKDGEPLTNVEFRETVEFLSKPHRQLIKLTRNPSDFSDPYRPCNIVPRNMYLSGKSLTADDVINFHRLGIDDASLEFDFVEPTINHAFRFRSEALGGLDYGARFCVSSLRPEVLPLMYKSDRLEVLEVGGGTGSFAKSFIEEATSSGKTDRHLMVRYQIADLSPALIQSQSQRLSSLTSFVEHFQQDATHLDIPGRLFDLIIANEVIADFPVSPVNRVVNGEHAETQWLGPGAGYLNKYNLFDEAMPDSFLINTGAIQFLERAWKHISPGGALIVTEYGDEGTYPVQAYHLNHQEFSIHFGHLKKCAEQIGFTCRLNSLRDFLEIDDQTLVLDGQEEQIMCLNKILGQHDQNLPYALITEPEFKAKYGQLADQIGLTGVSFSPLINGFHFGPRLGQFMVLVMSKPE